MTKKNDDQTESLRASAVVRAHNAAKAAGAQQVVDLLGNHPATPTARKFVASLGGVQDDYTGDNPVAEMDGVDEILSYCRNNTGYFMGNAPGIRNAIQERIDVARRKDQSKAVKSVSERHRRTPDFDG